MSFNISYVYPDQASLLRTAWPALFVLGLVQCGRDSGLPLASLLTSVASHLQTCLTGDRVSAARVRALMASLASIRSCAARAESTHLTREEFAYLRLCILFKTSRNWD